MILLVTMSIDPHTDLLIDALKGKGMPFFRYNTDLADNYAIEISMDEGRIFNLQNGNSVTIQGIKGGLA